VFAIFFARPAFALMLLDYSVQLDAKAGSWLEIYRDLLVHFLQVEAFETYYLSLNCSRVEWGGVSRE
jgi:hypothetical protein